MSFISDAHRRIAESVARQHGFTLDELRTPSRRRVLVAARRAIAVALREAGASWHDVGDVIARDHTAAIWLVKHPPPEAA